jgi:hypothetical protein
VSEAVTQAYKIGAPRREKPSQRIPSFDGLRAISILIVIFDALVAVLIERRVASQLYYLGSEFFAWSVRRTSKPLYSASRSG